LNYVYRPGGTLSYEDAIGIAAFLNSTLVDRYFRITNGNTQVNATELRKLPLPSWERLTRIGERVAHLQDKQDFDAMERIIMEELAEVLAEIPEHMIHYNGERFLGPHEQYPQ
ncbi:MAG TPA: hypothetical protein VFN02_07475, partial [Ktedonobacteraceae bacterium]|nr:hypothetical protein [Ktedonobacteraceae bacterium]